MPIFETTLGISVGRSYPDDCIQGFKAVRIKFKTELNTVVVKNNTGNKVS